MIPPTVPVQLGEKLEGVSVWVKSKDGGMIKAKCDLFPGLWILLDPADWDQKKVLENMRLRREEPEND